MHGSSVHGVFLQELTVVASVPWPFTSPQLSDRTSWFSTLLALGWFLHLCWPFSEQSVGLLLLYHLIGAGVACRSIAVLSVWTFVVFCCVVKQCPLCRCPLALALPTSLLNPLFV